jgi:hypothetical protein
LFQPGNVFTIARSRELGMAESEARFVSCSIADFQPEQGQRPDIVLALHACDTATDEALALAVKQVGYCVQVMV